MNPIELGNWIVERQLNRGGMGEVYAARHKNLGTPAAVKVLRPEHANVEEFRRRFEVEAKTQANLKHPGIARVVDYMEKDGTWYLVMEFLEGGSLRDQMTRAGGPLPADDVLDWAKDALEGLEVVHQAGIVHRDIKPDNILLNKQQRAVVTDFGIARVQEGPQMTATGMTMGTPSYMSPEQLTRPNEIDSRTDVFAMGVVIYELLCSQLPFGNGPDAVQRQLQGLATPLRNLRPDLSPELERVLAMALHRDPRQRFANAGELLRALQLARGGSPPGAPISTQATTLMGPGMAPTLASGWSVLPAGGPAGGTLRWNAPPGAVDVPALPAPKRRETRRGWLLPALAALVFAGVGLALMNPFEGEGDAGKEDKKGHQQEANGRGGGPPQDSGWPPGTDSANAAGQQAQMQQRQAQMAEQMKQQQAQAAAQMKQQQEQMEKMQAEQMKKMQEQQKAMEQAQQQMLQQRQLLEHLPPKPVVAVISGGEPLLSASLEQQVENRLRLAGYDVRDELNSPALAEKASKGQRITSADARQLVQDGFHVLVTVNVVQGRSQRVEKHGFHTEAFASQIRMNAVLLPTASPIGRGWSEMVEYTEMSAQAKAERSLIGPTADLIGDIRSAWAGLPKG